MIMHSMSVRPVEAQRVALAAGQNGTLSPFVVYVEDDKHAERFCWLHMQDGQVRAKPRPRAVTPPALKSLCAHTAVMLCRVR